MRRIKRITGNLNSTDLLLMDDDFLVVADRCKKRLQVFRISTGECIYAYKLDFSPYEMAMEGDLLCVSDLPKGKSEASLCRKKPDYDVFYSVYLKILFHNVAITVA